MKKFSFRLTSVILIFGFLVSICGIGVAEGLLPQLDEVLGVGMPSLGDVLSRYPDLIETNESGDSVETYIGITEEDYQAFGQYLADQGCEVADYTVEGAVFKATVTKKSHSFLFEYDTEHEQVVITYPDGSFDERVDSAETLYIEGKEALTLGDYSEAYNAFTQIVDYALYKDVANILAESDDLLLAKWTHDIEVGSTVSLGAFEQDNDETNGKEPIEWLVIGREDDSALLLSKYVLLPMNYNDNAYYGEGGSKHNSVTWKSSTVRNWLNNSFLDSFLKEEKGIILTTDDDVGTIFLLSRSELEKYIPKQEERICAGTPYAEAQELSVSHGGAWWWLRGSHFKDTLNNGNKMSQSNWAYEADLVYGDGEVSNGSSVSIDDYGVRPALWLDIASAPPASWIEQQKEILLNAHTTASLTEDSTHDDTSGGGTAGVAADPTEAAYLDAMSLLENGQYEEAYDTLAEIIDYKDAHYLLDYNDELFMVGLHRRWPIGGTLKLGVFNLEAKNSYGMDTGDELYWEILEYDGNKALICTSYYVDKMYYNNNDEAATNWSKCSLRKWLNGTFYKNCFTNDEKKLNIETKIKNPDGDGISGGPDTTDRVFITDTRISGHDGWAWLRKPGSRKNCTATENGHEANAKTLNPIYPMMWIDLVKYDALSYVKVDSSQYASEGQSPEEVKAGSTTMQKGSKGDDVKRLQQALIDRGYLTGTADGQFGKMTEAAVKAAQEAFGLPQTGVADSELLEKLLNP